MVTQNDVERDKLVSGGHVLGVHEALTLLGAPSGSRPRIYAYLSHGDYAGQTVALRSRQNLDAHVGNIQFIWLAENRTIRDIVGKI